ncbi:MAG: hypothetical protein ACOY7U_05340 [Acidobacteriota bacterium]
MQKREIASLAIKLMALLLAFETADAVRSYLVTLYSLPGAAGMREAVPFLVSVCTALGMGLVLWISSDSLAKRAFPETPAPAEAPLASLSSAGIMQVGVTIIGIWLAITAFLSLINSTTLFLFAWGSAGYSSVMGASSHGSSPSFEQVFSVHAKAAVVYDLVKFVLGAFLAINPGRALGALEALREKFTKPDKPEVAEDNSES